MSRDEVRAVLSKLDGDKWLAAAPMYGTGMRLMECLTLRVQDIDFERSEVLVRNGKGAKDRVTMLPETLKGKLREHLARVKKPSMKPTFRKAGGAVPMPDAVDRKYTKGATEWPWQYVFPQERRWKNAETGRQGRNVLCQAKFPEFAICTSRKTPREIPGFHHRVFSR